MRATGASGVHDQRVRDVWAVVDGYGEEFTVHAVFEDRADAERWAAEYRHPVRILEDVRVEPMPLYAPGEEPTEVDVYRVLVTLRADGAISDPRVHYARILDSQHGDLSTPVVEVEDRGLGELSVWAAAWSEEAAVEAAMGRVEELRTER